MVDWSHVAVGLLGMRPTIWMRFRSADFTFREGIWKLLVQIFVCLHILATPVHGTVMSLFKPDVQADIL